MWPPASHRHKQIHINSGNVVFVGTPSMKTLSQSQFVLCLQKIRTDGCPNISNYLTVEIAVRSKWYLFSFKMPFLIVYAKSIFNVTLLLYFVHVIFSKNTKKTNSKEQFEYSFRLCFRGTILFIFYFFDNHLFNYCCKSTILHCYSFGSWH